jgi:hypothetical protein
LDSFAAGFSIQEHHLQLSFHMFPSFSFCCQMALDVSPSALAAWGLALHIIFISVSKTFVLGLESSNTIHSYVPLLMPLRKTPRFTKIIRTNVECAFAPNEAFPESDERARRQNDQANKIFSNFEHRKRQASCGRCCLRYSVISQRVACDLCCEMTQRAQQHHVVTFSVTQ